MLSAALLHTIEATGKADTPITVDTKIPKVIGDEFVAADEFPTQRATLRDALYRRMGYPRHDISYGGKGFTAKDAIRSLRHLLMCAGLRERFQYCNLGYMALQHVVETITGTGSRHDTA